MKLIRAAGGIVWRDMPAGRRLAVVHRARRDDWSLPKGKLDPDEGWQDAARREIAEETGWDVRLGRFAGAKLHLDRAEPKLVLYWHAQVVREVSPPEPDEIDEVEWLSVRTALDRLDHASDRRLVLMGSGELRSRVILDSRKAEEALPSVLGLIRRALASGAAPVEARRA